MYSINTYCLVSRFFVYNLTIGYPSLLCYSSVAFWLEQYSTTPPCSSEYTCPIVVFGIGCAVHVKLCNGQPLGIHKWVFHLHVHLICTDKGGISECHACQTRSRWCTLCQKKLSRDAGCRQ